MIEIKALLFDFDGVLADTEAIHWNAWNGVLAPHSIDLDWLTYQRQCIGTSDYELLDYFRSIAREPLTLDQLYELYRQKRMIFRSLALAQPLVDKRVVSLLARMEGLQLAVVTSSSQLEVEPILRRAGVLELLNTAVYGNDVTHHKPDPEPYLLALERFQVRPSQAVVFEDSASGIRSGLEAGCRVVTVKSPSDLPGLIEGALVGHAWPEGRNPRT